MEDKKRVRQRSTPEQLVVEKHAFKNRFGLFCFCCFGGIGGKWYGGLMDVERRVFKAQMQQGGGVQAVEIGRGAAVAPGERSPGKELQVQPVGSVGVRGKTGSIFRWGFFMDSFKTFHIQRVAPPSFSYKILFWPRTVLFFSDVSCVKCAIPPPCLSSF